MHVTGKLTVSKKSISVKFIDSDDVGAITTHTCSNEIIFPRGFVSDEKESYHNFCATIKSVTRDKSSFNMV